MLTDNYNNAITDDWQALVTDDQIGRQVNWRELFGNDNPVQIEIGTGKATTLLELARLFPEHNFLGIEWTNEYCRYGARRMKHWGFKNVRMLRTDAREFVIDRIAAETVLAVHVYFPDPWRKARHYNRRLFIGEFCDALARVLVPKGQVHTATDHENYGQWIREKLSAVDIFDEIDRTTLDGVSLASLSSNYEAKFEKEGRAFYRMAVRKNVKNAGQ